MYIQVECSSDIRMSEYRTDSFIVATALYTSGGETVSETMEFDMSNAKFFEHSVVIVTVSPRLDDSR